MFNSRNSHPPYCRLCQMHSLALKRRRPDDIYVWLKNELNFFGWIGFEAELYRLIERFMK